MTTFEDLPAPAVRLITRAARTRVIPGTNRYAKVCRRWRDAAIDSEDQEQLQLLLALEGLPADTAASEWLERHGACVTYLHITYDPATAPLFQQLPLSTAQLVGLVRLEVDGPDSLVALAPALPQLVGLTHLRASFGLDPWETSNPGATAGTNAPGQQMQVLPCLQQLCPGLKSLHLNLSSRCCVFADASVGERLPAALEQLCIHGSGGGVLGHPLNCAALTSLSALRRLSLQGVQLKPAGPDLLLSMPGLKCIDVRAVCCGEDGRQLLVEWLALGHSAVPQHRTKVTGARLVQFFDGFEAMYSPATGLSGLRKLQLIVIENGAAACVQQLSVFERLSHLHLWLSCCDRQTDITAMVSALSSVQQLTYLRLSGPGGVPRTTWAVVLPHHTQLRVLVVKRDLLEGGLAVELHRLSQLQCLYVQARSCADPAVIGAQVAAHMQVLSACMSLRAVLCWSEAHHGVVADHPLWEYVHQGRLHLSCWHRWQRAAEEGRVVCPRPCPHLPGVWELQQEEEPADGPGSL
jgi:hypothetical protein